MAAIGSAAGLGNLWRFPYLAYEHGGAAFFLAYFICLILIGLPFLIAEIGVGQITRKAAPQSLAITGGNKKFGFIGWLAIMISFSILTYYIVITSWTVNFAIKSFHQPWAHASSEYFYTGFLNLSSAINIIGSINISIVVGTIITLILLFLAIYKGTSGISLIANWVTPIPFILLIILLINSINLTGAGIGIQALLVPKWNYLNSMDLWFDAASQVLFSLSLAFGVMFAYGAILDKNVNIKKLACVIILGDTLAAMLGGVIIFSVLGHMAYIKGLPLEQVVTGGIGLAFVVIPKALSLLPYASTTFSVIFYMSLFLLAYTSIVSLFESILAGVMDGKYKLKRPAILFIVALMVFLLSLLYSYNNGLYMLDIVDHFISGYGILAVSIFECIIIGWVYGAEKLRYQLKKQTGLSLSPLFNILIRLIIPITLITLFIKQLKIDISTPYEGYPLEYLTLFGVGSLLFIIIIAKLFQRIFD
jgi:neurotransmitter:Na+ symporter, NSS family